MLPNSSTTTITDRCSFQALVLSLFIAELLFECVNPRNVLCRGEIHFGLDGLRLCGRRFQFRKELLVLREFVTEGLILFAGIRKLDSNAMQFSFGIRN